MRRPLRRKDRAVYDRKWIDEVLGQAQELHLAINGNDGWPYAVPVNFGYDGEHVWFHGAMAGLKHELIERDPRVCFNVYVDHALITADDAGKYSYRFRSVTGFGIAHTVTDPAEKIRGLNIIMDKYRGPHIVPGSATEEKAIKATWVVRVDVEYLSGKDHP